MKKIYSLAGSVLLSGFVFGQAPSQHAIYSFANGEKYTPGAITVIPLRNDLNSQDRTTYYTQNFDAGFGAWGASIQTGTAPFKLTNTGHDNTTGNTFIIPTLMTSTPTQWVVLDSDADGTSYSAAEASKLTSNKIDLSATTGQFVALEFDQFFAEWDINTYSAAGSEDHCYIAVSLDSMTWTEIEINEGVGREARPNPELVSWDITDIIAPDNSQVWVRFRWEGAWNYGWQIDNVNIIDINEKDLTIMDTYRGSDPTFGIQYSMVPEIQATEFVIGAIVRNTGHVDQTNIGIDFEIKDPSNTVVASGSAASTVTLANSEQDTFWVATGFTPVDLGTYTITWTATSTEGDDDLTDNTVMDDYFELTEFTYAQDFAEGAAEGITNWPLETGEGRFGNLYGFPIGDEVSAIQVKIANNASNVGQLIYWTVYYNDGTGWLFMDEASEDYEIQSADLGQIISLPVGGIDVNETDLYLFMVGHYATPTDAIFERQGNIGWNYIQGAITAPDELASFFDRKAPIVRVRVGAGDVSVGEENQTEHFAVYPNPAVDALNVSLSLNGSENTVINVLDLTGKVVKTINLGDVNGSKTVQVSLDEMNSGVYFIELVNQNGRQVEKFVKK